MSMAAGAQRRRRGCAAPLGNCPGPSGPQRACPCSAVADALQGQIAEQVTLATEDVVGLGAGVAPSARS
eukprot:1021776-Pyramimonas_sp.AAC.1